MPYLLRRSAKAPSNTQCVGLLLIKIFAASDFVALNFPQNNAIYHVLYGRWVQSSDNVCHRTMLAQCMKDSAAPYECVYIHTTIKRGASYMNCIVPDIFSIVWRQCEQCWLPIKPFCSALCLGANNSVSAQFVFGRIELDGYGRRGLCELVVLTGRRYSTSRRILWFLLGRSCIVHVDQ